MDTPNRSPRELYLECIDGKDLRHHFPVGDNPVKIGPASEHPHHTIQELGQGQGYLIFRNLLGQLSFDADHCLVPVFLNNQPAKSGLLNEQDLLRIGNSVWKTRKQEPGFRVGTSGLKQSFNGLLGLEELHDFKLGSIFSNVFRKHSTEEMEEQLITGTASHTPFLDSMEIGWGKPWLFARLLGISALLAALLYAGFVLFSNENLVPGLIFVGSFAVPVSTLIFFLEMNVPRNISIFMVMQLLFVGGVISILVALVFYSKFDFFETFLGASAAGIIEESAKILIVILLVGKSTKYPWILNGLLFGAAVGTGFGAFESAGYAFNIILGSGMEAGVNNIITRGILAPFMHVVWTANVAAALWIVKKDQPFRWDMLKEPAFLRILAAMMLAHMLWNAPFSILQLPLDIDLKNLLLGLFEWAICFRLIQAGVRQLTEARAQESAKIPVS